MNLANVGKSLLLGLGIGVVLLFLNPGEADAALRVVSVAASGAIGLVVGFVTEWLTSLLPIRVARTGRYFLINGAIAVVVTASILGVLVAVAGNAAGAAATGTWWPVVALVVAIVVLANVADYALHRRTQARLRRLQDALARADAASRG